MSDLYFAIHASCGLHIVDSLLQSQIPLFMSVFAVHIYVNKTNVSVRLLSVCALAGACGPSGNFV